MDFLNIYGTTSGGLAEIRDCHYTTQDNLELYFGPYLINKPQQISEEKSIAMLRSSIKHFAVGKQKWPRSKIKELRTACAAGKASLEAEIVTLGARGLKLMSYGATSSLDKLGHNEKSTPYMDAIEMLEFYPQELLDKAGE